MRDQVPSVSDDVETEVAQFTRVRTTEVMLADHRSARSIGMRALHDDPDRSLGLTGVLQLTSLLHLTNLTAPPATGMRATMQSAPTRGPSELYAASRQTKDVTAARLAEATDAAAIGVPFTGLLHDWTTSVIREGTSSGFRADRSYHEASPDLACYEARGANLIIPPCWATRAPKIRDSSSVTFG